MFKRSSLAVVTAAALGAMALVPTPASADKIVFEVVGTSDVYDSYLVQKVIEPAFETAYPQYDLRYVSKGTGAAIAYAQAGTASTMIVHAAALENQFVDQGWSLEGFGRAIFWGDYVLLGPEDDPAGVLDGAQHDIVGAFEKVAAAGEEGKATFVSRGGTPGTTVQEHAIWALSSGVTTCDVSTTNGGGTSPSTGTGACSSPIALPDWYKATGLTQAPNVLNGDVCNYDFGGCYVFTDRGTFNYLNSTGQTTNLSILTRDNNGEGAPGNVARGGYEMLVNSFHAYALDPDAPGFADVDPDNLKVDPEAGVLFLNWITSPEVQAAIGAYLNPDSPFLPSAAPAITADPLPASVKGGTSITVRGNVANVVPGYPALDGLAVNLVGVPSTAPGSSPVKVAAGVTDANGDFAITFKPTGSMIYTATTDAFEKVQIATLDPVFGDRLAAGSAALGEVKVKGVISKIKAKVKKGQLTVTGTISPKAKGSGARVFLTAVKAGKKGPKVLSWSRVRNNSSAFKISTTLGKGKWKVTLKYENPLVLNPGTAKIVVKN